MSQLSSSSKADYPLPMPEPQLVALRVVRTFSIYVCGNSKQSISRSLIRGTAFLAVTLTSHPHKSASVAESHAQPPGLENRTLPRFRGQVVAITPKTRSRSAGYSLYAQIEARRSYWEHALDAQFLSGDALWCADRCDQREVREAFATSPKGNGQHRALRRQRRLQSYDVRILTQPL